VRLATDIRLPVGGGSAPTILVRTPYGRGDQGRDADIVASVAVNQGFALVIQDVRGRGDSGGRFHPFWHDAQDAQDAIGWIGDQPWSDGDVMMAGASYSGLLQLQAARRSRERLVAIAPTVSGALVPGFHPGGAVALGRLCAWLTRLLRETRSEREFAGITPLELFDAMMTPDSLVWECGAPMRRWLLEAEAPEWRAAVAQSPAPVAALHTTGWYDVCGISALRSYRRWSHAADAAAPQRLTLGPWAHDVTDVVPGDLIGGTPHDVAPEFATRRQLGFFRELGHQRARDTSPAVMSYVMRGHRWHEGDRWPPRDAVARSLWLDRDARAGGRLGCRPPSSRTVTGFRYAPWNPVPTHGGANALPGRTGPRDQRPIEDRADVVVFTTEAFDRPTEVACCPQAWLVVSSSAPATCFVARLTFVDDGGRSINIAEGAWAGRLADLERHPATDGRVVPIELGPVHLYLDPGFRLRLQVTSSNAPELYPHPNVDHDWRNGLPAGCRIADQRIHLGPDASRLTLAVRSGVQSAGRHR
jgi:putative CocE/NonD family hydrolase